METISLQNRVHFLISKFYYLTISQALQCIFFFFFFFASLGKFNYLFLWEINSSRLWWAGKFSFLRTKGLRALVGDIQTLTSFLSLFLPFCFCHHYHFCPFKCVYLASTKLWYVASGFYFSVEKRVKTFLSLRSFRYSRNLRNKTKQKFEIQMKKKKKKEKGGRTFGKDQSQKGRVCLSTP